MAERYTNCDIEVHLCNALEGMPLDGIDEGASLHKLREWVQDSVAEDFRQYTVHVHMNYGTYGPMQVVGWPDDVEPERIRESVNRCMDDTEVWIVETPAVES